MKLFLLNNLKRHLGVWATADEWVCSHLAWGVASFGAGWWLGGNGMINQIIVTRRCLYDIEIVVVVSICYLMFGFGVFRVLLKNIRFNIYDFG